MSDSTRRRTWRVVDPETKDRWGQRLETAALVVASLNVVAVVLQSIDAVYDRFAPFFDGFALVSVLFFVLLYALRLWAASTSAEYHGVRGRLRFLRRPTAVVDLVVVSVFSVGFLVDDAALGFVRVLWFARFFDLPRFRHSRTRFRKVLAAQREDLAIAFSGAAMLVLVASTLMFFAESRAQPAAFGSIPAALWWGVVTLTTVGYGDVVPVTPLGRFLGAVTTFGGVAFFALPSSILAAGFFAEREREQDVEGGTEGSGAAARDRCPHCGGSLHPGTADIDP